MLSEDHNRGQSAAVGHAAAVLAGEGVEGILTLPGDVPLVTAEEIEAVLDAHGGAHGGAPAVSIVPARDGRGSNCIALTPPRRHFFLFRRRQLPAPISKRRASAALRRALWSCRASASTLIPRPICAS